MRKSAYALSKKLICIVALLALLMATLPMVALAESTEEETPTTITEFALLNEEGAKNVPVGTEKDALSMPVSLIATAEGGEENALTIEDVTWECADYNKDTLGDYTFTAVLPERYVLAEGASLPILIVTVSSQASEESNAPTATINQLGGVLQPMATTHTWDSAVLPTGFADGDTIVVSSGATGTLTIPNGTDTLTIRGETEGTQTIVTGAQIDITNNTNDVNLTLQDIAITAPSSIVTPALYYNGGTGNTLNLNCVNAALTGGDASDGGHGLNAITGNVTITGDCTFTGGNGSTTGGTGLYATGNVTVTGGGTFIGGNSINNNAGYGLASGGNVTITEGGTFTGGNSINGAGGSGIGASGNVTLTGNVKITGGGNTGSGVDGHGILFDTSGSKTMTVAPGATVAIEGGDGVYQSSLSGDLAVSLGGGLSVTATNTSRTAFYRSGSGKLTNVEFTDSGATLTVKDGASVTTGIDIPLSKGSGMTSLEFYKTGGGTLVSQTQFISGTTAGTVYLDTAIPTTLVWDGSDGLSPNSATSGGTKIALDGSHSSYTTILATTTASGILTIPRSGITVKGISGGQTTVADAQIHVINIATDTMLTLKDIAITAQVDAQALRYEGGTILPNTPLKTLNLTCANAALIGGVSSSMGNGDIGVGTAGLYAIGNVTITDGGTFTGGNGQGRILEYEGHGLSATGDVTISNGGTFTGGSNSSGYGGHGLSAAGNITISNGGTFTGGSGGGTTGGGAGLYSGGNVTISNGGTFTGGSGSSGGDGMNIRYDITLAGSVTITGGSGTDGSGIYLRNSNNTVTMTVAPGAAVAIKGEAGVMQYFPGNVAVSLGGELSVTATGASRNAFNRRSTGGRLTDVRFTHPDATLTVKDGSSTGLDIPISKDFIGKEKYDFSANPANSVVIADPMANDTTATSSTTQGTVLLQAVQTEYWEHTDTATGVKISGKFRVNKTPSGLVVVKIPDTDPVYQTMLLSGKEAVVAYEASLTGSYTIAPGEKLTINFPVDASLNGQTILVRHRLQSGSTEEFSVTAANGVVTVTVDSLSPFMLLRSSTTTTVALNPKAGDAANIGLWIMLCIVAGAAIVVAFRYNRRLMR